MAILAWTARYERLSILVGYERGEALGYLCVSGTQVPALQRVSPEFRVKVGEGIGEDVEMNNRYGKPMEAGEQSFQVWNKG